MRGGGTLPRTVRATRRFCGKSPRIGDLRVFGLVTCRCAGLFRLGTRVVAVKAGTLEGNAYVAEHAPQGTFTYRTVDKSVIVDGLDRVEGMSACATHVRVGGHDRILRR